MDGVIKQCKWQSNIDHAEGGLAVHAKRYLSQAYSPGAKPWQLTVILGADQLGNTFTNCFILVWNIDTTHVVMAIITCSNSDLYLRGHGFDDATGLGLDVLLCGLNLRVPYEAGHGYYVFTLLISAGGEGYPEVMRLDVWPLAASEEAG